MLQSRSRLSYVGLSELPPKPPGATALCGWAMSCPPLPAPLWATQVLGVALGDSIYLWNAGDGSIQQLMQTTGEGAHVTSLNWMQEGNLLAVGTSDHKVQLWDTEKLKQACMHTHVHVHTCMVHTAQASVCMHVCSVRVHVARAGRWAARNPALQPYSPCNRTLCIQGQGQSIRGRNMYPGPLDERPPRARLVARVEQPRALLGRT